MRTIKLKPLDTNYLEQIGFVWHTDSDKSAYIADEIVEISEAQAEAFYEAGNTLYEMFVEAGEYVIEHNLFHELGIPFNLVDIIKISWENDLHWHLYGRFDLAGGIEGNPIKLLEFNADTPTALFETAIIQWAQLKYNNLDESAQFNRLYEALGENFKRLVTHDIEMFEERYQGWKILFSSIKGNAEEENTTRLLQHIATEAGFETQFAYIDEVEFSQEGIFYEGEPYAFWFKLIPWEDIAIEESDLAMLLTQIIQNQKAIILNPAYTLMFQSKAFMKILWDLYPKHPLLLETSFEPLKDKAQVQKRIFGREGANIEITDDRGKLIEKTAGEYESFKTIYQEYTPLACDSQNRSYQAGLFFAYDSCGLGFRRGGKILNNLSKFVGHQVVP